MDHKNTIVRQYPHRNSVKETVLFEHDIVEHCLNELFEIEFPWLKSSDSIFLKTKKEFLNKFKKAKDTSVWMYYPWSKTLIRFPYEQIYIRLRSARNRNLITTDEQKIIQSKTVGIAGMSVGSNVLNTLVLSSGPRDLKIADHDTISIPNLNRIMAHASAVGLNKAIYFARRSLEIDPFLKIEIFDKGLQPRHFNNFFNKPKLDLFIEEMDDPYLKIKARQFAKQLKIPVIMAADNGDGALIDIERFDLEPGRPLFHGRLDKVIDLENIQPKLSFAEKLTIIANMAGLSEATPRMQDSMEEVGQTLNTWPQLGTAALTAGVSLTFVARRILLGEDMPSGRYRLDLESFLVPDYNSPQEKKRRDNHTREIMKRFNNFKDFLKKVGEV